MTTENYIVNANTLGVTKLSGDEWQNALAVATMDGKRLLINTDGLYEVLGSNAVAGVVKTGKLILAGGGLFCIYRVDALIKADADVVLTLLANYNGEEETYGPYVGSLPNNNQLRKWLFRTGSGNRGTSYALQFSCTGQWECRGVDIHIALFPERF